MEWTSCSVGCITNALLIVLTIVSIYLIARIACLVSTVNRIAKQIEKLADIASWISLIKTIVSRKK